MVVFRTYLGDFDHWHSWRVGDDPAGEAAKLASWMRGMPHPCGDGGFSIPFSRIPDRVITRDGTVELRPLGAPARPRSPALRKGCHDPRPGRQ
jgi:hypothetical protein